MKGANRALLLGMVIGVLWALAACGTADRSAPHLPAATPSPSSGGSVVFDSVAGGNRTAAGLVVGQAEDQAGTIERLIVRTATLRIEVRDVQDSVVALEALAADMGGYVQESSLDGLPENPSALVRIRVPAERFQETLRGLRGLAELVLSEQTSSADVTEEYVDLNARLRNQRAVEERLTALLDRADTVSDVLSVQRDLTNVRQEVERLQGRIHYLEQSAAESTISVRLTQRGSGARVAAAWAPGSTFENSAAALTQVLRGIGNTLIVVGVFAPIWAPVALVGLLWYRRSGRREASELGGPGQQPLNQQGDSGD